MFAPKPGVFPGVLYTVNKILTINAVNYKKNETK